jgi:hypothetical protein
MNSEVLPVQRFFLLPRNICTRVETRRLAENELIPKTKRRVTPCLLGLRECLDAGDVFLAHVLDKVEDVLPLQLYARRSIGEGRRCLWAVREEHVGKAAGRQSKLGVDSICPTLSQSLTGRVFDVDGGEGTGVRVETGLGLSDMCIQLT